MMTTETIRIQGEESYDVVVCGGGTAGFCAAVAAAREGAKTCVLERRSCSNAFQNGAASSTSPF